jgi:hypothetical protein
MNEVSKLKTLDRKVLISTLWIVVMFNMVFADILAFMIPGNLEEVITGTVDGISMSGELMFIAAIMLEIPIAMIFMSRVLGRKSNRLLNIAAAIITIIFVVGGGSLELHYIFMAGIEVICMLYIIQLAWTWKDN